jgi:hypothetical protein
MPAEKPARAGQEDRPRKRSYLRIRRELDSIVDAPSKAAKAAQEDLDKARKDRVHGG